MQKIYDFKTMKCERRKDGRGEKTAIEWKYVHFVNIAILLFAQGAICVFSTGNRPHPGTTEKNGRGRAGRKILPAWKNVFLQRTEGPGNRRPRTKWKQLVKVWGKIGVYPVFSMDLPVDSAR